MQCLMFLDTLDTDNKIDLSMINQIETAWLSKSLNQIKIDLKKNFGIYLETNGNYLVASGEKEIACARSTLAKYFATPGLIDYEQYIVAVGKGITSLLVKKFDSILTSDQKEKLANFEVNAAGTFGLPEFERDFMAYVDTNNGICKLLWPDLNAL